jgi:uncharacterized protein
MRRLAWIVLVPMLALQVACSDYQKARRAYEVGQFTEALTILEKLAQQGDSKAQYEVALMYLQGIGTQVNPERGGYWMLAAANNGNTTAMIEVGGRHEHGVNAEQNPMIAFTWYRRAAIAGDSIGRFKLATLYEQGIAVPQDLPRAYAWYRLSGHTSARLAVERLQRSLGRAELDQGDQLYKRLSKNPDQ